YTKKFDGVDMSQFRVTEAEITGAKKSVRADVLKALANAKKNIDAFHEKQKKSGWSYMKGTAKLGQIVRPIDSVGCYIPGGKASYPSTVLMAAVPAKVAGVERIVVVTPPQKDGTVNSAVLAACDIAGVDEIYKIGGAHAIAALAFGTKSVAKVDKIIGPGNVYVTAAKSLVSGEVAIDMPAGPSEVLIIADDSANPEFVALDLAAQKEHDADASCVLVTTSKDLANKVLRKTQKIDGAIIMTDSIEDAVNFSNEYAPEHLQIMTKQSGEVIKGIKNAGSVFLGNYTPVACGDYASGTNHILPTGGFARAYSGLGVSDFVKVISVQEFDKTALKSISRTIITLAEVEGLKEHAKSIKRRLK
ncbi:histidinol dehydrogenase, partial [archaeon]|nr:histidinol dehydrogenase [archaeon]